MERKLFSVLLTLFFIIGISSVAIAEMGSLNFRIPTSVFSGGGGPMGSGSHRMNSTIGQPSPLMDPADPPWSANYDLYPGFWYTLEAAVSPNDCPGDFDNDGDVDGSDLARFAADFGRTNCDQGEICEGDFDTDNDVDGSDLATFATDFGRTDCPQ